MAGAARSRVVTGSRTHHRACEMICHEREGGSRSPRAWSSGPGPS